MYVKQVKSGTQEAFDAEEVIVTVLTLSAGAAKSLQSCLTLCDPIDGSPPGSPVPPVPGIFQTRTLEWVPFPSPMHESEK